MRQNGIDVAFIPSLIHQDSQGVCLELFSEASSSKLWRWDDLNVSAFGGRDGVWQQADLKDPNEHLAWEAALLIFRHAGVPIYTRGHVGDGSASDGQTDRCIPLARWCNGTFITAC